MKQKYYVEVSMMVEAWSYDQAEKVAYSIAQHAIGNEHIRESWVNYIDDRPEGEV